MKNVGVFFFMVSCLTIFLVYLGNPFLYRYIMAFVMIEVVLGCFSLTWSLLKNQKGGLVNYSFIIIDLVLALGVIILNAVYNVLLSAEVIRVLLIVSYYVTGFSSLALAVYAAVLDFYKKPVKEIKNVA